jgi:pimeloyl-ACP methyl ester carboxylesterase
MQKIVCHAIPGYILSAYKNNNLQLFIMKHCLPFLFILVAAVSGRPAYSQSSAKPVYVIVHGAWGGSWAFKKVDSLLTEKGCIVYRPSLTGQGERVHLASTDIGLSTHIKDVVNMILYEDLHDVILVGHSYGGMVVTGVADSLPGRITRLIYLDAFVPENGESMLSILGSRGDGLKKMVVNGFAVPAWVPEGKLPPKDVPHPFKTISDNIMLKNNLRQKIPTTYILTVAKGTDPAADDFASQAERAKKKNWPVLQLEADHNPQWSAPGAFVEMLEKIVKQ